jgi:hypothetical protein
MALKLPNGKLAETDAENASVMHPHLNKVYNNKRQPEYTVLDLIEQCTIMEELDTPFTWKEFSNAVNVNGLKNCKAPGLNGVPPEAFKANPTLSLLGCVSSTAVASIMVHVHIFEGHHLIPGARCRRKDLRT